MANKNHVYLVDTTDMTPEDRQAVKDFLELFEYAFQLRPFSPLYYVITPAPPEEFAALDHPKNFPWKDVTGWDLRSL